MPLRDLDPDNDYQYDRTNRPGLRHTTNTLLREMETRAAQCEGFEQHPQDGYYGVCLRCNGPKYAHTHFSGKPRV